MTSGCFFAVFRVSSSEVESIIRISSGGCVCRSSLFRSSSSSAPAFKVGITTETERRGVSRPPPVADEGRRNVNLFLSFHFWFVMPVFTYCGTVGTVPFVPFRNFGTVGTVPFVPFFRFRNVRSFRTGHQCRMNAEEPSTCSSAFVALTVFVFPCQMFSLFTIPPKNVLKRIFKSSQTLQ